MPGHLLQRLKTFVFPHIVGVVRELPGCHLPPLGSHALCSWTPARLWGAVPRQLLSFGQIRSQRVDL